MDNILSKSTTNALKGISAIEIMIGHLGIATGRMLLYPNRKAGILFVGLFFFISGYGLMFSYLRNKNYLKNFLIKKVVIIIVPAYLVYLLNGVFELIQTHGTVTTGRVLESIFLKEFFYRTNWYIFECLAFYILFWMLYKFLNKKHATVLLWIITLVFIATAFQMKVGNPWYGSSICFPFGVLYAQQTKRINDFILKKYYIENILFLGLSGINILLFFMLGNESILGNPIARNLSALFFAIWVISLLSRLKIDYAIFKWLGTVSFEIYLLHPMWIGVLQRVNISNSLLVILVIVFTLFSSAVLHKVSNGLNLWLNRYS